jgi:alpha-L-fucosidase
VKPGFGNDKETKPYTAEDFRFTQKGTAVYAIAMAWPGDGHFVIRSLGSAQLPKGLSITKVELLGSSAKLDFHQSAEALEIRVPASTTPPGKFAFAFRLTTAPWFSASER